MTTVLLVEDNEDNRFIYSVALRHVGYDVIEALAGDESIRLAEQHLPDIILMDISIPIIDGWEATARLKQGDVTRNIPIIALTAHALESDRARAFDLGCAGYISKPAEPRAVIAEVERVLDGHGDAKH